MTVLYLKVDANYLSLVIFIQKYLFKCKYIYLERSNIIKVLLAVGFAKLTMCSTC